MTHVSAAEFARIKAAARKSKRIEKVKEYASIDALGVGYRTMPKRAEAVDPQDPSKSTGNAPRTRVRAQVDRKPAKRRKPDARKRAFLRLRDLCKAYVFFRNKVKNAGMCEIAMSCGGANRADTWYHGWPQKGGNGLKYDVRSHFASCGPCNMGEYGARYRGGDEYNNRHKELLGNELYVTLGSLHGRRQIRTDEAREMGDVYAGMIERREFSL